MKPEHSCWYGCGFYTVGGDTDARDEMATHLELDCVNKLETCPHGHIRASCTECLLFVALKHAYGRLNAIRHPYAHTNFQLIEAALKTQEVNP